MASFWCIDIIAIILTIIVIIIIVVAIRHSCGKYLFIKTNMCMCVCVTGVYTRRQFAKKKHEPIARSQKHDKNKNKK